MLIILFVNNNNNDQLSSHKVCSLMMPLNVFSIPGAKWFLRAREGARSVGIGVCKGGVECWDRGLLGGWGLLDRGLLGGCGVLGQGSVRGVGGVGQGSVRGVAGKRTM